MSLCIKFTNSEKRVREARLDNSLGNNQRKRRNPRSRTHDLFSHRELKSHTYEF